MEHALKISATARTTKGKGLARQLRRQGFIPAVYYGRGRQSKSITVNNSELLKLLTSGAGGQSLIELEIKENDTVSKSMVMIKEYQVDPVRRDLLHADFFEVDLTRPVQVDVPVVLHGKPIGVDKGGLLQSIRRVISISVLPEQIPAQLDADVSNMDFGESLHAGDIELPDGVEILTDLTYTIATVVAPKGLAEEEAEEEGEEEAVESEEAEGEESEEEDESQDSD